MHGIVHKTLKEYVVDRTDDDTWDTIIDRADLEPTLYLPVSYYDDAEIDAVLETLSSMATQDRATIERDVGRALAPELLSTFSGHVRRNWDLSDLLADLETVYSDIEDATEEASLPALSSDLESDHAIITYETHRDTTYCSMARGVLEGIVAAFDGDGSVTETACVDDGADACRFRVDLE